MGKQLFETGPLGTGHAVRSAEDALKGFDGDVVVTYADTPLLDYGLGAATPHKQFYERRASLLVNHM